jgi:hypothetical protein
MRLVEFALRGVRRFEGGRKLTFQEGYNLLTGPNESGKSTCLAAVLATLEPERLAEGFEALVAGGEAGQARCGLVFLHDSQTCRIVRDLEQGAANLAVLDPATGKFGPHERDAEGVRRWLRETAGMPARRFFDTLLVLERAAMPSAGLRVPGAAARAGDASTGGGAPTLRADAFGAAAPSAPAPALTGSARAARIAELQAEIARLDEMSQVEFALDGVKAKLFEVEAEFGELRKLDQLAADLDSATGEFERLGLDPAQLEQRARNVRGLEEKRRADLASVEAECDALQGEASAPVTPVLRDPLVLGGAAAAAVGLGLGLVFQPASLGALAGLGAVLAGVMRGQQAAQRQRAAQQKLGELDERLRAIEKRFEIETKAVRAAQEALDVSGPEGILERIEAYRTLKARREAVAERRAALGRQKNLPALEAERQRLASEVAALEERLRGFGGTAAFDAGDLKRELAELQGRAPRPSADLGLPGAPWSADSAASARSSGPPGRGPLADGVEGWLEAAARVLGSDRDTLARDVLARAQPLVFPLTSERYRSLAFDADGRLVCVTPGGASLPAALASPATQDALYLALRLAGYALLAKARPWPLFLDDPLVALDDGRLLVACRALKAAARGGGQVIHLSARKLPPAVADSTQSLP